MPWILIVVAGLLEVAWAVGLKYSHGLTRPTPTVFTVVGMLASFWVLALAMRQLPLGTAYAVWTGIGAIGTTLLGMMLFREPHDWPRVACIALIVVGIVGLRVFAPAMEK